MSKRLPANTASPVEYARYTNQQWKEMDAFYGFWMDRWKRVADFLRSVHWRVLQDVDVKQIPKWRRFPIVNTTLAFYNDYLTQWLQSRVRFSALPDSPDPQEIAASELADHVLAYLWDHLELDSKRIDLGSYLLATGNADVRVYWNTDTGDMIPLAQPTTDAEGNEQLIPINPQTGQPDPSMSAPQMVDAGDIGLEVVPPQLVRWNRNKAHGVMVGYLLSYDEAAGMYGEEMANNLHFGKIDSGLMSLDFVTIPSIGQQLTDDAALIVEHYLPKSSRNPQGLWWTSSASQVITDPAPLPTRHIPVVHFRWVPMPGHPHLGLTPLYDITFSNKLQEQILARTQEWMDRVVPKVVRQTGDGLTKGEMDDEPFQEVVTQPGLAPDVLVPPAPPEQFFKLREDILDDTLMVGGYKLRRGKELPPGQARTSVRQPPKTINEGEQVALAVINSKPSWQKLGYVLLDYVAKFYTEPKAIAVVGQDRTYQWREFKGSDLANLRASLRVDEKSLYTWDRQSMRDTVISVMGTPAGQILFADEQGGVDRDRVKAAFEATGIDVSIDTIDPDIMEARNENNSFRSGSDQPQTFPWQNHEAHTAEHVRELKGLSFKGWPVERQQAFLQHVSEHEQAIAEAQQQSQEAMLQQEHAMRKIRTDAETSQAVRTALGEQLIEVLMGVLSERPKEPGKSPKK